MNRHSQTDVISKPEETPSLTGVRNNGQKEFEIIVERKRRHALLLLKKGIIKAD